MSRGFPQRSSPSVSIVTRKGVSDMARLGRNEEIGAGGPGPDDLLERIQVGGENLVLAVFPGHERAATITGRLPLCSVTQEASDRIGNLIRQFCGDSETLPLDHAVRIDQGHDGYASDPGLEVRIRKSFDIGGVDEHPGPTVQVVGVPVRQAAMERYVG